MKNLERVQTFDGMMPAGMALSAARLDLDAARADGYRQGVEDARSIVEDVFGQHRLHGTIAVEVLELIRKRLERMEKNG